MRRNPILDVDSYKLFHKFAYPPGLKHVYSYAESRGGEDALFFGTQGFLRDVLSQQVTPEDIDEAEEFAALHGLPFPRADWVAIVEDYDGYLPLEIRALDEGSLVPARTPMLTVVNTDERFPWLTSYIETAFLRHMWYSTTVATRIFHMRQEIADVWRRFADGVSNPNFPFALLDFSSRGCAGYDANELGGAAYLAMFMGSDSIPAVRYANRYYNSAMSGFSVPALEHSVMCSWGPEREEECFKNAIEQAAELAKTKGTAPIISCVADTWNVFEAAKMIARLAPIAKAGGVTVVFRPDSGTPDEILPEVLAILAEGFGGEYQKNLYVLDGCKVLWGDGINRDTHLRPFMVAVSRGFSPVSILTGSGGGLMQANLDRDTLQFAFKASAVEDANGWRGIAKDPLHSNKKSKKGRFVVLDHPGYPTTAYEGAEYPDFQFDDPHNALKLRWRNGVEFNPTTLDEIRARVAANTTPQPIEEAA